MNYKSGICILLLVVMLVVPASAIYEWNGRYYAGGGSSPVWNVPGYFYVVGGFNSSGSFGWSGMQNDTWRSPIGASGAVSTSMTAAPGWRARYAHRATPVGGDWVLLTGGTSSAAGYGGGNFHNDTWITTDGGALWTNLTATYGYPGWRARQGHMAIPAGSCMYVGGGAGAAGGWGAQIVYNDTWKSVDWGNTWTRANSSNSTWHARYLSGTTSDGTNLFFMGGLNITSQSENDVWSSSDCGSNWTLRRANTGYGTNPLPRYNQGLVHLGGTYLVMFGGNANGVDLNDTWISADSGATWTARGDAPWSVRNGMVAGYDATTGLIIMAGGAAGSNYYNDIWTSADTGISWQPFYSTTYATPGQYSWTAPAAVYNLSMNLAGSGGGGMGAHNGSTYAIGNGGTAGEFQNTSKNAVTPFSSYAISVGLNGTQGEANARTSYAGLPSTAFGRSAGGGLGGTQGAEETSIGLGGGSGENTFFVSTNYLAINGSILPGYAGRGYGAGGGGGGHSGSSPCTPGYGGSGAPGVVRIFTEGSWWENTPDFSATTTTSTTGTVIRFLDESTIRNNVGVYYLWNFGDGTTSTTQGNVNHSYAYPGSFTVSLQVGSGTGEFTTTREGYIQITGTNSQTWYSPGQVRFTVLDWLGNNVVGATVNATYVQSTMPTAATWLASVYGVNSEVASQMLSTNTVMSGTTGSDGAVVFTMHSSLQYNVSAWNSSSFIQTRIYPKEQDYNIWLPKTEVNNTYAQIGTNLTYWQPNASYQTLGVLYQDNSSLTQRVTFYVNGTNGTVINYTTMTNPGTSLVNITKTIPNTRGEMFLYGINIVRSEPVGKGNLTVSRGVTSKGSSGVLVDLRLPTITYYPWLSLFLLFLIASLASKFNVRFVIILMPIMAAFFWWFGWLSGTYLTAVIPFACLLGVVYYMKGSLRENYGIGGSGSMLMNIVVYLLIFQLMIGFINGLGMFGNQTAMATPANQFSNVDLTTIQNSTSNFGGINDPLQSANAFANIGWATMKIALDMIGAVFIVGIYLIEMFPYIPPEFFMIIQAGIWILYVLFIVRLVGKAGSEVEL